MTASSWARCWASWTGEQCGELCLGGGMVCGCGGQAAQVAPRVLHTANTSCCLLPLVPLPALHPVSSSSPPHVLHCSCCPHWMPQQLADEHMRRAQRVGAPQRAGPARPCGDTGGHERRQAHLLLSEHCLLGPCRSRIRLRARPMLLHGTPRLSYIVKWLARWPRV